MNRINSLFKVIITNCFFFDSKIDKNSLYAKILIEKVKDLLIINIEK